MMMARKQRDNGLFLYEREETPGGGGSSLCGVSSVKRLKTSSNERSLVASQTESFSSRERKDKFGERVVALQQLVSPYGKTDTASVLQEAADYIRFLHEQVQVLSSPYLQTPAMANRQGSSGHCSNLRNQGLCLVPLSHASGLAGNNGADIWAPMNTSTSPKF